MVKRCPNPIGTDSEIEIRPVFEMEDFGAALTPEIEAQDDRVRARRWRQGSSLGNSARIGDVVCVTHGEASAVRA